MSPRVIRFALNGMFNESQEVFMDRVAEVLSRLGDEYVEAVVNGVVKDVRIVDEEPLKVYYDNPEKENFVITKITACPAEAPDAFKISYDYEYTAYKKDADDNDWNSALKPDERRKFKFTRKSTGINVYHLNNVPSMVEQAVSIFSIGNKHTSTLRHTV